MNNMRISCGILQVGTDNLYYTGHTVRILCVATKPPWPPRDGGRLALWLTLQGLAGAGHEIALVAPGDLETQSEAAIAAMRAVCTPHLVSGAKHSWFAAAAGALNRNQALTVARHHLAEVEQAVAACVFEWRPDVVHAEQLQAFLNCGPARAAGIPTLLRMQNVESSLWHQVAMARLRWRPLLLEARRLRADEACAMAHATRVVALTERDAIELRGIAGNANRDKVIAIEPPFPSSLPPGPAVGGAPAIILAGSGGWWPNWDGASWFLEQVAPPLVAAHPEAQIHVYASDKIAQPGGRLVDRRGVVWHPAPDDAVAAFPAGAIAVIPLRIGSGIRMRILEAWARGLPVVATSIAASGLRVESGRELLLADTPTGFLAAFDRLVREPACRAALAVAGRAYLARHHDSRALTGTLLAEYQAVRRTDPH